MQPSAPASRFEPPIPLVVFVVGAASLGAEIAVARLLAPYFGASTIVWANTIATVLVALSIGYWAGGRLADRLPERRHLYRLVLVASLALATVPFVAKPFLSLAISALDNVSAGAFFGSLVGVLGLVAGPVLLLGAVTPFAVRLSLSGVEESGRVSGRLYAISTAGSLAGTFLAALVLVPFAGTQRTFLAFALALALAAAAGLRRSSLLVPLGLAILLVVPSGQIKSEAEDERVLHESETPYQYARVLESPDGTRRLELNEGLASHSVYRPGRYLTGDYWDSALVLPFAILERTPRRVAILGNAAGTMARMYGRFFPRTRVDGVEIDRELTDIGRRFFDMRNRRLRTYAEDARPFLRRHRGPYDVIVVDAYRQPYIPFYLATREFFDLARDRLARDGVLVVNVGHPDGSRALETKLGATMAAAFAEVRRFPAEPTNTMLVASRRTPSAARLRRRAGELSAGVAAVAEEAAARLRPRLSGGEIYTDDRAPVEWLVDGSILRYAADSGR
jgi:spermidine synthase